MENPNQHMVGQGWSGGDQDHHRPKLSHIRYLRISHIFYSRRRNCGEGHRVSELRRTWFPNSHANKCTFPGYQDTLYLKSRRHIYRECDIYENVDFIFGDESHAIFQNSSLTIASGMQLRKEEFVAYLGRPWIEYSTVVIMDISPLGWGEWPPKPTGKLSDIEYKNRGPGANVNGRVNWTGYHALDRLDEVKMYIIQ
ncbi:hypothetical protein BUALT_BualtUnG0053200 [Buddleja alternifolia]|uniref:Pectinesterase catalytic domain-containing protein n=1 Tax=Buddleja alternifolia TaxID=168488 RepID=A0AAV6W6W2_9LAMI|nr:hypothetical protein BUALT_BualtUnG0053200 [Buddleja alternifolia]